MLHSTCLYIIEMLEFIAKQRLAPPKSETLSDSHHAHVYWIILIGAFYLYMLNLIYNALT